MQTFTVSFSTLAAMLVIAPKNGIRSCLNGVHFERKNSMLYVVTTDGHRMLVPEETSGEAGNYDFSVAKVAKHLGVRYPVLHQNGTKAAAKVTFNETTYGAAARTGLVCCRAERRHSTKRLAPAPRIALGTHLAALTIHARNRRNVTIRVNCVSHINNRATSPCSLNFKCIQSLA